MTTTEDPPTLERAGTAAPRPELDWERDWQGRPRILPDPTWDEATRTAWADGRADDEGRVPYTRVTTFAEALQDSSALTRWKLRRAVLGMGRRPDYVVTAASLTADDRDRDALDDLAEKALEASGPNAADVGTAIHAFTERVDRGEPLGHVPEEYAPTVAAYQRVAAHLRFVEFECRTVCDELEVAGTPDRFGFCDVPDPDGVVDDLRVIDTKTGRVDYSAGKFSTQLAVYAHSHLYHPGTGARTTLEERHGAPVNRRWGLIVHVPAGRADAELLWIRLDHGWTGALEAGRVREWRAASGAGELLLPVFARAPRPATTDGTCRGRRTGDGKACSYRARKGTEWCGRHAEQQKDLARWLAENPGVDPESGEEQAPVMEPVQPSLPPAVPVLPPDVAADWSVAAQLARRDALLAADDEGDEVAPHEDLPTYDGPPFDVTIGAGIHIASAAPDDAGPDQGVDVDLAAALGSGTDRCPTTDLLVEQCACPLHHGGMTPEEEAQRLDRLPPVPPARDLAVIEHLRTTVTAQHGVDDYVPPARELPSTSGIRPHRHPATPEEADELRAAQEAAPMITRQEWDQAVGTYALDPAAELNGNRRPVSGLSTPAEAHVAAARAQTAVLEQIQLADSESALRQLYAQHAHLWTPELTDAAGHRSRQLAEARARARPEAALLAAIETAPDHATLTQLWSQFPRELWTAEAIAVARTRRGQLDAQADL